MPLVGRGRNRRPPWAPPPGVARYDAARLTRNLSVAAQPQSGASNYHGGVISAPDDDASTLGAWTKIVRDARVGTVRGATLLDGTGASLQPYSTAWLARCRHLGLKVLAIVTKEGDDTNTGVGQSVADTRTIVAILMRDWSDVIAAIEGPNEPNHSRTDGTVPPNWLTGTWAHQYAIHDELTKAGRRDRVPVILSSLHDTAADQNGHYALLRDYRDPATGLGFGDIADYAGLHLYAGGRSVLTKYQQRETAMAPLGLPLWITEGGWHNALHDGGGHWPVTEEYAAHMLARTMLQLCVVRDRPHTLFEVLDQKQAPVGGDYYTSNQHHFGALAVPQNATQPDTDPALWRRKPHWLVVEDWLAYIAAHATGPHNPTAPAQVQVVAPSTVEWIVLGHPDGTSTVAAWQTAWPWVAGPWDAATGTAQYRPASLTDKAITVKHPGGVIEGTVGAGVTRINTADLTPGATPPPAAQGTYPDATLALAY